MTIRSRRRERGLSQESLADLAEIDRSYMSSVERGLRNVSILNIARIARALGVPVWELLRPRRSAPVPLECSEPTAAEMEQPPMLLPVGPESIADYERDSPSTPPPPASSGPGWEPRYLSLG